MRAAAGLALLLSATVMAGDQRARLGPLLNQTVPPIPACVCFAYEAGKKGKGLILVEDFKGEEARINIDGRDELLRPRWHKRYWERKEGEPAQYEYVEKDLSGVATITVDLRAYGPYRGGEAINRNKGEREGSLVRGTISISGPSGPQNVSAEGECGC